MTDKITVHQGTEGELSYKNTNLVVYDWVTKVNLDGHELKTNVKYGLKVYVKNNTTEPLDVSALFCRWAFGVYDHSIPPTVFSDAIGVNNAIIAANSIGTIDLSIPFSIPSDANGHQCIYCVLRLPEENFPSDYVDPSNNRVAQYNYNVTNNLAGTEASQSFISLNGWNSKNKIKVHRLPMSKKMMAQHSITEADEMDFGIAELSDVDDGTLHKELDINQPRMECAIKVKIPKTAKKGTGALFCIENISDNGDSASSCGYLVKVKG